jgi:hypothetical protein
MVRSDAAAEIEGWFIVLGSAGVPDAVVQRLNTAINKVLAAPATAERLAALGAEPQVGPPQDVTTLICNDRERWGKVRTKHQAGVTAAAALRFTASEDLQPIAGSRRVERLARVASAVSLIILACRKRLHLPSARA